MSRFGLKYGAYLHEIIKLDAPRTAYMGTFFFRNRPELDLLLRLLREIPIGSTLDLSILGCSKGAEVYSFVYVIRSARPDLKLRLRALDIETEVLEFAKEGVYSLRKNCSGENPHDGSSIRELTARTFGDQSSSVFERMSADEIKQLFDCDRECATVKPQFRDGITWHAGDAADPKWTQAFGLQDIVVANRFLCHMQPAAAESCLRSLARLVKPGGYLFVSGVDLAVRAKVARDLQWQPVTELIAEVHEGDPSLRRDWPLQYWGLEPLDRSRSDWQLRYASVFQIGSNCNRQDKIACNSAELCTISS